MTDKASNYLGIMRKAGKLAIGEVDSGGAVRSGKTAVLCLAQDASDNARRRAEGFVYGRNTPLIRLPYEKETLSRLLGKPGCSMIAVLDPGLASAFVSALAQQDDTYAAVAERLQAKTTAAKARHSSARNGKRRNNV